MEQGREELESLVALMDDDDSVVARCVDERLRSYGPGIIRSLVNYSENVADRTLKSVVRGRAESLNSAFRMESLRDFALRQQGPLSLFEGGFLVCSLLDCTLQRDTMEDLFFKCSAEYLAEASDQRTAIENINVLNYIFFTRLKFTLCDVDLAKPEFMLVSDALRTRQGNPFVLAYIYLMIAQVAGLPLRALCFPGGFVPAYEENGRELFLINIYRGGSIFNRSQLKTFLGATGLKIPLDRCKLREDNSILMIYLESLQYVCSRNGQRNRCEMIEKALALFGTERFLSVDEPED